MITGLSSLLLLGVVGAIVFAAIRLFGSGRPDSSGGPEGSARRIVLYALLFLLVTLAAVGIAGLLGLLLPDGTDIAGSNTLELARSLAFTLIAGPLTAGLWAYLWNRVDPAERASVGWPLYLSAMGLVSLIVATTTLLSTASQWVAGDWHGRTFAVGITWTGVCLWHRWMFNHPSKAPTKLTDLLPVAGSALGLVVTAGGATALLTSLFDQALSAGDLTGSSRWWEFPAQALVWTIGGAFVWWWYRLRERATAFDTSFADASHVILGTAMPVLAAMGGAATALWVGLLWVFQSQTADGSGEGLPPAIALLLVGSAVWAFHRKTLLGRTTARRIAALLVAGSGLAAAASGVGIIVNATLEAFTQSLVDTDRLGLLFAGLSALVVGAPVWFLNWKPTAKLTEDRATLTARNVYLVAVFGASALAALVSLLVIVYRVFVYVLESGTGFVDEVRAPFGLLVATGLVAAYHYPIWKRDRALAVAIEKPRSIDHVILVTGADPDPLRDAISASTGAAVTVWRRADIHDDGPTAEHVAEALEHTAAKRVLVVTGPGAHLDVIPLAE